MGRIVSLRWRFGTTSPGACTYTMSVPLTIAESCHGEVGFPLYQTRIGIYLSYQQQANQDYQAQLLRSLLSSISAWIHHYEKRFRHTAC